MRITINDATRDIDSIADRNAFLSELKGLSSAEIWLEGPEGSKLCILINASRCFVMHMENEDEYYVTFDKNEEKDQYEDFVLANGQLDEYPKNMTVKKENLNSVVTHFFESQSRAESLSWVKS